MTRIHGIPDLPEPTFRTHDGAWVSLDTMVTRVCAALGGDVSPLVAKHTIQLARWQAEHLERIDVGRLAEDVTRMLRGESIVVTPVVVQGIVMAYTSEYAALGVVDTVEAVDRRG